MAEKAEAIHQIDSVFGILLVIVVFLFNATLTLQSTLKPILWLTYFQAFWVAGAILAGLLGLLKQSWPLKMLGWFAAFIQVFNFLTSLLVMSWSAISPSTKITSGQAFFVYGVLTILPVCLASELSVLVWDAYNKRMLLYCSSDITLDKTRLWRELLPRWSRRIF